MKIWPALVINSFCSPDRLFVPGKILFLWVLNRELTERRINDAIIKLTEIVLKNVF